MKKTARCCLLIVLTLNSCSTVEEHEKIAVRDVATEPSIETKESLPPSDQAIARPISTLEEVLRETAERNPILKSYEHRVKALSARITQAGLRPNPSVALEVENVGGNTGGVSESETTLSISQLIETGGKRAARVSAAEAERAAAELEITVQGQALKSEIEKAYAKTYFAGEFMALAEEDRALSEEAVSTVRRKVDAGGVLATELVKAEISLREIEIELQKARAERRTNASILSSFWGGNGEEIGQLQFEDQQIIQEKVLENVQIDSVPKVKAAKVLSEVFEKRVDLERTRAIPDLTISGGVRRLEESNGNALVGALSIPLPVFDRNQGAILAASEERRVAGYEYENLRIQAEASLAAQRQRLESLKRELQGVEDVLIPKAARAYEESLRAYNEGRASYLDLVDARRTLLGARRKRLDTKLALVELSADIRALLGIES